MSEYDEYASMWDGMLRSRLQWQSRPELKHPVKSAKSFVQELEFLSALTKEEYGTTCFAAALAEIRSLGLIDNQGRWRKRWEGDWEPDRDAANDRVAVANVEEMVAAGVNERTAIAYVVWDFNLPGASFDAAWKRLRDLFHEANPDRQKPGPGRRKKTGS